jgi:hypothetical protein
LLDERRRHRDVEIENIAAKVKDVERKIGNLLAAIEEGFRTESTKSELQRLEALREELRSQQCTEPRKVRDLLPRALDDFKRR